MPTAYTGLHGPTRLDCFEKPGAKRLKSLLCGFVSVLATGLKANLGYQSTEAGRCECIMLALHRKVF